MANKLRCRLFDAAGIVNSIYIQLKRLFWHKTYTHLVIQRLKSSVKGIVTISSAVNELSVLVTTTSAHCFSTTYT